MNSVQEINQKSQSNFLSSFFFLPPHKRRGIEAVYAFSRLVDDAVDESASPEEGHQKLSQWKMEIEKAYQGRSENRVMQEISCTIEKFGIPKKYFEELLEGVGKDLEKNRYANFRELCEYTYGVASVVGLICMKIFEVEGDEAEEAAILLGRALQMTNILRDIRGDAILGRIYLPQEDMNRFSVTEEDLLQGRLSVRFDSLMCFEINRTEEIYTQAFRRMKKLPRKSLLAAWIMGKIYYRILQKIKRHPRKVLKEKVKLPAYLKISITLKEWARSFF